MTSLCNYVKINGEQCSNKCWRSHCYKHVAHIGKPVKTLCLGCGVNRTASASGYCSRVTACKYKLQSEMRRRRVATRSLLDWEAVDDTTPDGR